MATLRVNTTKINKEMKRLGINGNAALAKLAGLSRGGIWQIMRLRIARFESIEKIAKAFDCDPKDLLT